MITKGGASPRAAAAQAPVSPDLFGYLLLGLFLLPFPRVRVVGARPSRVGALPFSLARALLLLRHLGLVLLDFLFPVLQELLLLGCNTVTASLYSKIFLSVLLALLLLSLFLNVSVSFIRFLSLSLSLSLPLSFLPSLSRHSVLSLAVALFSLRHVSLSCDGV